MGSFNPRGSLDIERETDGTVARLAAAERAMPDVMNRRRERKSCTGAPLIASSGFLLYDRIISLSTDACQATDDPYRTGRGAMDTLPERRRYPGCQPGALTRR